MEAWYSRGSIRRIAPRPEVRSLTIGSVRVDTAAKESERISYMCEETGIGSGAIFYEHDLFLEYEVAVEIAKVKALELVQQIRRRNVDQVAEKKKRGQNLPLKTCPKCKGRGEIFEEKK